MFSFFEVTDGCNWVEEWTTSVNELQDKGVGGSTLFFQESVEYSEIAGINPGS